MRHSGAVRLRKILRPGSGLAGKSKPEDVMGKGKRSIDRCLALTTSGI